MGVCQGTCNQQEETKGEVHRSGGHGEVLYFKSGNDWPVTHNFLPGKRQSPIDIKLDALSAKPAPLNIRIQFPFSNRVTKMSFNDHGFKADNTADPIGYINITTTTNERQEYQSRSLHYHTKSEHTINGIQYDAELHMVFERVEPKALEDNFCVLGFIFKIDDANAKKHGRDLITTFKPGSPDEKINVEYAKLFEPILKNPAFYHYLGGLTTPPCTETVKWFVYSEILSVLKDDLKPMTSKWIDDKKFSNGKGNARCVQDICARDIFKIVANN